MASLRLHSHTDGAHDLDARQRLHPRRMRRGAENPKTHQRHRDAFEQRRGGAARQAHAENREAEGISHGVAEEVERIGLERHRIGAQARRHLDREHCRVEAESYHEDGPDRTRAGFGVIIMTVHVNYRSCNE